MWLTSTIWTSLVTKHMKFIWCYRAFMWRAKGLQSFLCKSLNRPRYFPIQSSGFILPACFFRVILKEGKPLGMFRKSWITACKEAGLPGKLFYNFRRTAARNFTRAQVSESIAMSITGHKTNSMFRTKHYQYGRQKECLSSRWRAPWKSKEYPRQSIFD